MKKILLTGGGTAGHVTPNLALVPELRKNDFEIHYAGTKNGIEHELISKENIAFHFISAGKLRRYFDFKNFTDIFRIFTAFVQSLFLIARIRPNVVFSKGGFVSCPVVWASWIFRKPVIIHESDITPGLANRLSVPFASKICYSFPETAKYLPSDRAVLTGLPVRDSLFNGDKEKGRKLCKFDTDKPVILVIGGSQGSEAINSCIRKSLDNMLNNFNICHLCGKGNSSTTERKGYCQFEYVNEELPHLFALADLVISRSGATTLFEIISLRKPNLLIPLETNASRGDQILNAHSFEKQGFSRILKQSSLTPDALINNVNKTFSDKDEFIKTMEKSNMSNGIARVIEVIENTVKN
ncbi:MAG TPA: undecaprenyldiphospho-muramoylpentapeptide beta-N-acetylglucosaminyltransferase [Chitinispirillaceae bacterium]|nr:undecaprenyldiphospho-muramoylpentapeptide beta-N-acetylglucosaminyltransferase [Chitinispirillaceae bacterium]